MVPLSWGFALYAAWQRLPYAIGLKKPAQLRSPVIVVGNLILGGAGKTPVTLWLVDALRARGFTPGVISRGYGGTHHAVNGGAPLLVTATTEASVAGDEPVLIAGVAGAPMCVAHNRVAAGAALLAAHPNVDVLVSDDGLQHTALGRAAEIVVFDERLVGNGWLFPAGPLREGLARLKCADALIVASPDDAQILSSGTPPAFVRTLVLGTPYALSDSSKTLDWRGFSGTGIPLIALAGIAHPPRFAASLKAKGIDATLLAFPDHHRYTSADLDGLPTKATVLMTAKDSVKLCTFADHPALQDAWVVPLQLDLDSSLADLIVEKLRGRKTA